jgi:hypothetical protein
MHNPHKRTLCTAWTHPRAHRWAKRTECQKRGTEQISDFAALWGALEQILACGGLAVGVIQRRFAFAALIFTRGSAASRASLSSRSRAILARTAIVRSATSCIAFDASSAKMRFRSSFATFSEIAGSGLVLVMTLPVHSFQPQLSKRHNEFQSSSIDAAYPLRAGTMLLGRARSGPCTPVRFSGRGFRQCQENFAQK